MGKGESLLYSKIDYNKLFLSNEFDGVKLRLINLGKLSVTSGKIIACDPLVYLSDSDPFEKTIFPGEYDVIISAASTVDAGERYAAAMLKVSNNVAVKWEMALTAEDDVDDLKEEDDFFGFPVDAGLGCFCDSDTQLIYDKFTREFYEKNPDGNIYDDYFAELFKENAVDKNDIDDIGDWVNFHVLGSGKQNVIMFHSGFGDGFYPCYWGIDSKGEICSLIIDFMLF